MGDINSKINTHGGYIYPYLKENGCEPLDFSVNISPLPVPEEVKRAFIEEAEHLHRYPDNECTELREKLSAKYDIPTEHIVIGNGASDLIYRIAYALKCKNILIPVPSFSEYEAAFSAAETGIDFYHTDETKDFAIDSCFAEAISQDTDAVIMGVPSNPSGKLTDDSILKIILKKCREYGTYLMLDECFLPFIKDGLSISAEDFTGKVIIIRSFTKIFAMPGVRLGYCLCGDEKIAEKIKQAGAPWQVNSMACKAGNAALEMDEYVEKVRNAVNTERSRLYDALEKAGARVVKSDADFILFRSDKLTEEEFIKRGIMIRNCGNFRGLDDTWHRIAVKNTEGNDKFTMAIADIMGGRQG